MAAGALAERKTGAVGRRLPAAAVRKVEIPKPQGGVRTLGIPTVLDRLIQQALIRYCNRCSSPSSPHRATAFVPDATRAKRCKRHGATLPKAGVGSLTSTWRSSSTG